MRGIHPVGYFSKREASEYLGLSQRTLEKLAARGEVASFKPVIDSEKGHNRKVLFRRADLDAWLDRFRVEVNLYPITGGETHGK